jgi:PAS domain S-box-containing protein
MSRSDRKGVANGEQWFRSLIERAPDPTWIIDGNRFVECNDAAIMALGYSSREELLNTHPSKLSPPRQADGEESFAKAERMMGLAKEKGLHRFEWMHTKADGTEFVAEVTLSTIELEHRQVIYCVWRDITERKSNEEKLLRQNNMLAAIIENFPGGISLFDADLRLAAHNDTFKHLMGLPESLFEKPGVRFEDLIRYNALRGDYGPGDPEQQVAATVARARNFQAHKFERVRPNGVALEIRGEPLAGGGFVTTYVDITERKQAEEALHKSEERWKFALEGANDGVWDWNVQAGEILYSKRWKEMFGFAEDEFGTATSEWSSRIHPEDMPQVRAIMKLHLENKAPPPSIEYRMRCKDGHWKWTLGRGMVVSRDSEGAPLRLVGTNSDISERKLIEQELVRSRNTAEARRAQVASLLDNSGQGFLSFGSDLVVDAECSRACEAMLGQSPAGRNATAVFFDDDAAKGELFCTIISSVLAEPDPAIRESMLSLLPIEIQRDDALLKAEYTILDNGKFMAVLTDITTERRMAAMLGSERRRLELIVMAVSDSRNFFDTINAFTEFLSDDLPRLLKSEAAPQIVARELYREIHTYKGLLNQFSFPNAPGALHDIETGLSGALSLGESLTALKISDLVAPEALSVPFHQDLAILSDALGEEFLAHGESFILSSDQALQLEALATRLLRGEIVDTSVAQIRRLLVEISTLRRVSFSDVLRGFDGLVKQAAASLEKQVAPIVVSEGVDVWIDPLTYRPFLRSLVHVFRNAVAHGIETPEARWEAGKDETGKITCSVALERNAIKLSIADDGGGIDLDALRQRIVSAGIYSESDVLAVSDEELARLIFMDNISTQREVSELAGRGVGLAALLSETINFGGEVVVKTVAGQGTEFLFRLPLQQGDLSGALNHG